MRWMMAIFGSAALACVAAGCIAKPGENAEPSKKATPVTWDDQSDMDWLHRQQFKTRMRSMWIGANRIVSAGRGDKRPAYDEIWASAADIRDRAAETRDHWQAIADHLGELKFAVEDDDRIGAAVEFRAAGISCDRCHMANWSPAYLHVTEGVVGAWLKNDTTPPEHDEVDPDVPPATPHRVLMQEFWRDYLVAKSDLEAWDKPNLLRMAGVMEAQAAAQAKLWGTVAEQAGVLASLAEAEKRDGMQEAYQTMANTCAACHAAFAGAERTIMNPMPWDK